MKPLILVGGEHCKSVLEAVECATTDSQLNDNMKQCVWDLML